MKRKLLIYSLLVVCFVLLGVRTVLGVSSLPSGKSVAQNGKVRNTQSNNAANPNVQTQTADAQLQKIQSQLQKLVEKGIITQDQADTRLESLKDIFNRIARVFPKSLSKPSLVPKANR